MFSSAVGPALIGKTLAMELWFQRNGEETFASQPRSTSAKSASACGENDNKNGGACGCFHKGDLHIALTLLKKQAKIPENHQSFWTNYFFLGLDDIKTQHTEPEVKELVISKLCHIAWKLLTAHISKQNNLLLIPQTR